MSPKFKYPFAALLACSLLFATFFTTPTYTAVEAQSYSSATISDFAAFVKSVSNGEAGVVRGVFVPGLFAAKILQQPTDNAAYVSPVSGVVTEYGKVKSTGNIGLLAHNYLTGSWFSKLSPGQEIRIVYGDGKVENFIVKEILQFQAVDPDSASSDLIDLDTGVQEQASTVFKQVYTGQRHMTLQTCIYSHGTAEWGRLFVIAVPATSRDYPFSRE